MVLMAVGSDAPMKTGFTTAVVMMGTSWRKMEGIAPV